MLGDPGVDVYIVLGKVLDHELIKTRWSEVVKARKDEIVDEKAALKAQEVGKDHEEDCM